ncbi:MAG: tRNA (adenosine(37)-N6)-threonylcarbamoyltransferase complex dimerization subunit type 1 TsaB [Bryobacteraceae bacterium]
MSPRILSLDTTSEHGSLALIEEGRIVGEFVMDSTAGFGHVLFGRIEDLLHTRGWDLSDVDAFAAAAGPGSFTGIRVGLAAVKGLAMALGRQAVAVSNLQALAWHGSAPLRAAVIDARRGEVYGAVYSASLQILQPEVVTTLPRWLESLPGGDLELVAADGGCLAAALEAAPHRRFAAREGPQAMAGAVGAIAWTRLKDGLAKDPGSLEANYVRLSDAELLWKEPGSESPPKAGG